MILTTVKLFLIQNVFLRRILRTNLNQNIQNHLATLIGKLRKNEKGQKDRGEEMLRKVLVLIMMTKMMMMTKTKMTMMTMIRKTTMKKVLQAMNPAVVVMSIMVGEKEVQEKKNVIQIKKTLLQTKSRRTTYLRIRKKVIKF